MNFPFRLYPLHPRQTDNRTYRISASTGTPGRLCLGLLVVVALLLAATAAVAVLLLLDGGQGEGVARAAGRRLPQAVVAALVPGQGADPGLDVVVQAQLDAVGLGDARRGVRDLVLWALVLEGELASV